MSEKVTETMTKTVVKTIDTVFDPIKQRLSSPIVSSFALSWILFNWKAIVYLIFSGESMKARFEYIENEIYLNSYVIGFLLTFAIPLLVSSGYVLFLSRLENWIDDFNLKPLEEKMERQSGIVETDLEHKIKEQDLRTKLEDAKSRYKNLDEAREQIKDQQAINENLKKDILDNEEKHRKELLESEQKFKKMAQEAINNAQDQLEALRVSYEDQGNKLTASVTRESELSQKLNDQEEKHINALNEINKNHLESTEQLSKQISDLNLLVSEKEYQVNEKNVLLASNASQHKIQIQNLQSENLENVNNFKKAIGDLEKKAVQNETQLEELGNLNDSLSSDLAQLHNTMSEVNDVYSRTQFAFSEFVQTVLPLLRIERNNKLQGMVNWEMDRWGDPVFGDLIKNILHAYVVKMDNAVAARISLQLIEEANGDMGSIMDLISGVIPYASNITMSANSIRFNAQFESEALLTKTKILLNYIPGVINVIDEKL